MTPALFVSVVVTGTAEQGRALLATFAEASYGLPLEQLEQIIKLKEHLGQRATRWWR